MAHRVTFACRRSRRNPQRYDRDTGKPLEAFGLNLDEQGRPLRGRIDTKAPGDYGADPIGNGMFRMVPSGDIVDLAERQRRLRKTNPRRSKRRNPTHIDHSAYEAKVRGLSDAALRYVIRDAQQAIKAHPTGHKAGYYADEINYCASELARRRKNPRRRRNPDVTKTQIKRILSLAKNVLIADRQKQGKRAMAARDKLTDYCAPLGLDSEEMVRQAQVYLRRTSPAAAMQGW